MVLMNGLALELMCFKASKRWVEVSLISNVPTFCMCIFKWRMNAGFWGGGGGAGLAALLLGCFCSDGLNQGSSEKGSWFVLLPSVAHDHPNKLL